MPSTTLKGKLTGILYGRATHGRAPSGMLLPPVAYRMGGQHFRNDEAFVASAKADVQRLRNMVGLGPHSSLLDWGCGAGRLAIGIAEEFGSIADYHGVDAQAHLISWARRHLQRPRFRFSFADVANDRYNPGGVPAPRIPGDTAAVDVIYAYSVYSHMRSADSAAYLREFARILKPGSGRAFFTAFAEDSVGDEVENPDNYGPLQWQGSLHCVRYNRRFFQNLISEAGLVVTEFVYGQETDGQSLFVVERKRQPGDPMGARNPVQSSPQSETR